MIDSLLYFAARSLIAFLQALPLRTVARLGRIGGLIFYCLDFRHRRVALRNLDLCFGSARPADELRAIARENFRRIGENYASAVKTAALPLEALKAHLEFVGTEKLRMRKSEAYGEVSSTAALQNRVFAIGHFGNFELCARFGEFDPAFRPVVTYRGFRQPAINRLVQSLRSRSGCRFFERRAEMSALKAVMQEQGVLIGFMSDQHAGRSGVRLPFFGHACSTTAAPAVFALRYHCPLHTLICYRTGLAQWRVEVSDEIPTQHDGKPRSVPAILSDVNRALENAILRDPANWFWVHDRWKLRSRKDDQ